METIGQCIVFNHTLSVEQADEVCRDLDGREAIGRWETPPWVIELSRHYLLDIKEDHVLIQLIGWRATAKAYQCRTIRTEPEKT